MHAVVTAELARRLTAEWTLSYAEYEVLVALTDHPEGSLRLFEIAGRLGWEQSRVSHQVDQTVKRELVA
jgi:DNA-binding MarR family transcriptional regulator